MAIYFKGSNLVKGKKFVFENEIVIYTDKIYGDHYLFTNITGQEFVLTENETENLKDIKSVNGKVVLEAQEDSGDLLQLVSHYSDKILKHLGSNKEENFNWEELKNLLQEELNKLISLGYSYKITPNTPSTINEEELYEMIKSYIKDISYNISDTALAGLYTMLNKFILMITKLKTLGGNTNGDME